MGNLCSVMDVVMSCYWDVVFYLWCDILLKIFFDFLFPLDYEGLHLKRRFIRSAKKHAVFYC